MRYYIVVRITSGTSKEEKWRSMSSVGAYLHKITVFIIIFFFFHISFLFPEMPFFFVLFFFCSIHSKVYQICWSSLLADALRVDFFSLNFLCLDISIRLFGTFPYTIDTFWNGYVNFHLCSHNIFSLGQGCINRATMLCENRTGQAQDNYVSWRMTIFTLNVNCKLYPTHCDIL